MRKPASHPARAVQGGTDDLIVVLAARGRRRRPRARNPAIGGGLQDCGFVAPKSASRHWQMHCQPKSAAVRNEWIPKVVDCGRAAIAYFRPGGVCWTELGYLRSRAGLMRCMTCGEPMVVTAVVPHEAMTGFAYRVLHCSACGTIERRLVFGTEVFGTEPSAIVNGSDTGASSSPAPSPCTEPAISPAPPPPERSVERRLILGTEPIAIPNRGDTSAPSAPAPSPRVEPAISPEPPPPEPSKPAPIRASAWDRAVEKLRSHQAALHARADEAKKADWTKQFNRAWEKLAPSPHQPAPAIGSTHATDWSRKALRAEMRKLSGRTSRNGADAPVLEPSAEAAERFNKLWERLLSPEPNIASAPQANSNGSALSPPLPRSLSLVAVEAFDTLETLQAMSAAKRVILLLRGILRVHP